VERQRREVNHSSPSGDEVKSEWSYTFTSLVCLRDVDRENIVFHMFL